MDFFQIAKEIHNEIIQIRRHLHQNPELSSQEYETSKFVASILEKNGIEVTTCIANTGVVGLIKGAQPGKTIALRADMDALPVNEETNLEFSSCNPGVMHACGHDIHTSTLIGAALLLNRCKSNLRGNVKLIFQPAEEKLYGAVDMIKAGVLQNPTVDSILALHCWPDLPAGTIGVKKGAFMAAADSLEINIIGKSGHAAHPHKCIDPIVIAGHVLTSLQTIISRETSPVDSAVITIGKIEGGTASNIIAPNVRLSGTVRTVNPDVRRRMPEIINRIVSLTAESMGGTAEVNYISGTPPLINDNNLIELVEIAAAEMIGKANVHYLEHPSLGGEDFAFYLEHVPGAMFRLGTANKQEQSKLPLHNASLIFDEDALIPGIAVLCETAFRYLAR